MVASEKCSSFPLYSPLWVVLVALQKKTWRGLWTAGRFGEGTAVKEVRMSNFDYDFTKIKQIGFVKKKKKARKCVFTVDQNLKSDKMNNLWEMYFSDFKKCFMELAAVLGYEFGQISLLLNN